MRPFLTFQQRIDKGKKISNKIQDVQHLASNWEDEAAEWRTLALELARHTLNLNHKDDPRTAKSVADEIVSKACKTHHQGD